VPSMSVEEARARLAGARVARMATITPDGRPHIFPFVFAVGGDRIVHAIDHKPKTTARLQRIVNIEATPAVSVLADHYAEDWEQLWWVRADGVARVLTEPAERAEPVRLLAEKYRQYRERPPEGAVISVEVTRWTGWTYMEGDAAGSR
jgi:PPOX class probable F420-dependent enzyme